MFLLPLFIMHDVSQYAFTHSTSSIPSLVKLIVFIFSGFGKPFIPFLPDTINNFLGVFIYIYIVFAIFYLTRPGVKAQFESAIGDSF